MTDPYRKRRAPTPKSEPAPIMYASRVIPFRFAFAGFDVIDMLPPILLLPQPGADIELILKKRNKVLIEIIQDLQRINL